MEEAWGCEIHELARVKLISHHMGCFLHSTSQSLSLPFIFLLLFSQVIEKALSLSLSLGD